MAYDLLLSIPSRHGKSDMNSHLTTVTHETEKRWVASSSARMSVYTVNRGLPITCVLERTVEDRLSEGSKLFQAEGPLFNHKPLYFKAHSRQD